MNNTLEEFLFNFGSQLDETPISQLKPELDFHMLEEWSSMTALLIIAMVDEIYKVKLTGIEIKESNTIEQLYNIVIKKVNG